MKIMDCESCHTRPATTTLTIWTEYQEGPINKRTLCQNCGKRLYFQALQVGDDALLRSGVS